MARNLITFLHTRSFSLVSLTLSSLVLLVGIARAAPNDAAPDATASGCSAAEQTSAPKALISNGIVNAVVYLPNPTNGYNRGSRFDWSGVVGCLAYKGHTYFGVWFPHYDPLLHDAITGPVEEFRAADGTSALLYDQAKPGELFLKPGIGFLRKVDDSPFKIATPYPLVDGGKWTEAHVGRSAVSFRQDLKPQLGIGYVYKKTLKLDPHAPVLILEHELKNTGTKAIETEVYDHDFFMLDGAPTGAGMVARFPFELTAAKDLGSDAKVEGKQIVYGRELQTGESAFSFLTGYSSNVSDYDIVVENRNTGVGVEQTSDSPIARLNFWSIRTTICPEAYIHLNIPPGQTAHWTIRYRFYAK